MKLKELLGMILPGLLALWSIPSATIAAERVAATTGRASADSFGLSSGRAGLRATAAARPIASVDPPLKTTALSGQQKSACIPGGICRGIGCCNPGIAGYICQPCAPVCNPRPRCAPCYPSCGGWGAYQFRGSNSGFGVPSWTPSYCPPRGWVAPGCNAPGYIQPGWEIPVFGQVERRQSPLLVPGDEFDSINRDVGFDSPFFQ